jgi:hypothetical protein
MQVLLQSPLLLAALMTNRLPRCIDEFSPAICGMQMSNACKQLQVGVGK